jgi:hypothetical protein
MDTVVRSTFMSFTDTQRRMMFFACGTAAAALRMLGGPTAERDALEYEELGREVLGFLETDA